MHGVAVETNTSSSRMANSANYYRIQHNPRVLRDGKQLIRTGLFRYVRYDDIDTYHKQGWLIVANLDKPHSLYSVLMWHCDCGQLVSL